MNLPSSYKVYSDTPLIDGFSILIPSWNNLEYLKICINGILKNSTLKHQIIVAINEGFDETLQYVEKYKLDFVHFKNNAGVCYAVNAARTLARSPYIMYMNDDMYPLPKWDSSLLKKIKSLNSKLFMLSATMIEPVDTQNPCTIVKDFGKDHLSFDEKSLCDFAKNAEKKDWFGASWPPFVVHRDVWDLVGGFGIEFTPGFYSDPDFSMKLYKAGVRDFIGIGSSLVYHFGTKSTKRVKRNKGKDLFLLKWGVTASDFYRYVLKLGNDLETVSNYRTDFKALKIKYLFKSILAILRREKRL